MNTDKKWQRELTLLQCIIEKTGLKPSNGSESVYAQWEKRGQF